MARKLTSVLSVISLIITPVFAGCCDELALALGASKVVLPATPSYNESFTSYYAQQEGELDPFCYVKPTSAEDVSVAVGTLSELNAVETVCPFAVRGGGHHTVIGIANIDEGITIDLRHINQTSLNADQSIASVGAGARWLSVYEQLDPLNIAVLGGRNPDVGVGGSTTGGGISFFGHQHGFVCDMVSNFEVVLASGAIVNANAEENSDLWRVLKGGGNNFGVVTRFDLKTFPLDTMWGGWITYDPSYTESLIEAYAAFNANPDYDEKATIEPVVNPSVYANFTATPSVQNDLRVSKLTDFALAIGENSPNGIRQTSITVTVKPTFSILRTIHDLWTATVASIGSTPNLVYVLTYQPITKDMIARGAAQGGNVLGLEEAEGPLVVVVVTAQYTSSASDGLIESTTRKWAEDVEEAARAEGSWNDYKHLNYADKPQDVIQDYGAESVEYLREAAEKYDPDGFFQKVQPGGFKL